MVFKTPIIITGLFNIQLKYEFCLRDFILLLTKKLSKIIKMTFIQTEMLSIDRILHESTLHHFKSEPLKRKQKTLKTEIKCIGKKIRNFWCGFQAIINKQKITIKLN